MPDWSQTKFKHMSGKERLCDTLYNKIIDRIRSYANGVDYTDAWVVTWHLRLEWGYSTSELNYHLNKLVKEGKMLKKSSCYCTEFRPISVDGFEYKDNKFYHLNK